MLKKAVWPSGQRVWLTIWWSLSPGATPLYMPCGPKGDGFCAVLVWKRVQKMNLWSEIGSGFKEPWGTTLSRIPGLPPPPPRTVVKTFYELEWRYLLYPWFGKHRKKRIEFLKIHKSWQIEKAIGKVSVRTDSYAFFYHVFTNKRLHSCQFPLP